jgi:putative ABC transport system permease protein
LARRWVADRRLSSLILKQVPALHGYVDVSVQPVVMADCDPARLGTGIAGALYPAAYAMRIRAVEALRFE